MIMLNIGINIASAIIYDVAKKMYSKLTIDDKYRVKVKKYIKDNISNEFIPLYELSSIEEFFSLPQIVDVINSYIVYVINGNITNKLLEINKHKPKQHQYISDDDVIQYISKSFTAQIKDSIVSYDELLLKRFIKHIFAMTSAFFVENMGLDSKVGVFETNRRITSGINFLSWKIENYASILKNALEYPLTMKTSQYDKSRNEYMNILKRRHNKALIYLLDDFDLDKFYIPPSLTSSSRDRLDKMSSIYEFEASMLFRTSSYVSWENIFGRDNIVYVSGGAGYGKSLLLKNMIINYEKMNITGSSGHIVILGEIKWFLKNDGSFRSMVEYLNECVNNYTLKRLGDDFIQYYLDMGRCILLLDALDEVPMERRKELHHSIIANLKELNPNNKVCITSRDRGFIPVDEDIEHFAIESLDPQQIEQYVDKIIKLKKFDPRDKVPFIEQAKSLIDKGFLNSFLILSLLISIYKGERELPETKLELYQKCLEYIANKREKSKIGDQFEWKLVAPLLKDNTFIELSLLCFPNNKEAKASEISNKLMAVYKGIFKDIATLENAVSEFLKFCFERTELFVPANIENTFKFFHRSFFEYFYSKHIVLRSKNINEIYDRLTQFDVDSEIFELTLARLKLDKQDDYMDLINFVFDACETDFQAKSPTFKAFNVLVLFLQVIDEETFMSDFVNLIINNADLLMKNSKKMSNQEIILNIISLTDSQAVVLNAYEMFAYKEFSSFFKSVDIKELTFIFQKIMEDENIRSIEESFNKRLLPRRFFMRHNRDETLSFYTTLLLSENLFIDVLMELVNIQRMPKWLDRNIKKINAVIEYYNSLTKETERDSFNKLFTMYVI